MLKQLIKNRISCLSSVVLGCTTFLNVVQADSFEWIAQFQSIEYGDGLAMGANLNLLESKKGSHIKILETGATDHTGAIVCSRNRLFTDAINVSAKISITRILPPEVGKWPSYSFGGDDLKVCFKSGIAFPNFGMRLKTDEKYRLIVDNSSGGPEGSYNTFQQALVSYYEHKINEFEKEIDYLGKKTGDVSLDLDMIMDPDQKDRKIDVILKAVKLREYQEIKNELSQGALMGAVYFLSDHDLIGIGGYKERIAYFRLQMDEPILNVLQFNKKVETKMTEEKKWKEW